MIVFGIAMAVAIVCSVAGDFLVKQGTARLRHVRLKHSGPANLGTVKEFIRRSGILRNGPLLAGIGLLALHFVGFLIAMKLAPVTVVVPLMSCTYVATALMARSFLKERISGLRWAGIAIIMAGVVLIGLSTLHPSNPRPGAPAPIVKLTSLQQKVTGKSEH